MTKLTDMSTQELSRRLDALRSGQTTDVKSVPEDVSSLQELVYELQVYQIELEMQNRELRETRRALEAARDCYADLFDYAPIGYLDFDVRGRIVHANITAMCMLGGQRTNLPETPFTKFLLPEDDPLFFQHLHRVLLYGDRASCQLRLGGRARAEAVVRLESIAIMEEGKGSSGVCRSAMLDITEQVHTEAAYRQQQEALTHAERLSQLGELASGIAHEINQPLSALLTYAQMAQRLNARSELKPEQLAEMLDKMATQATLGGDILRRIRRFARKTEMIPRPVQLNEILADAVQLTAHRAQQQGIDIELTTRPGLPAIMADPVEIQQVVVNLVVNAIEAVADAGMTRGVIEIRVGWSEKHNQLECWVMDSGPGPEEEQMSQLFQPFYTTKREGMGLGLSISHSIIERHGGELRYAGRADSQTRFCFSLPAAGRTKGGDHAE